MAGKRSENLLASDKPAALDRFCLRAERNAACRGCAAFREWLRIDSAIVDNALVVDGARPLVWGGGGGFHLETAAQGTGPQRRADVHVPVRRVCAAISADLGGRYGVGLIVGAEPAVLPGDSDAEQAGAMQVSVIFGRECGVAIIGRRAAREHILSKHARGGDDRGLLVVQPERLRMKDSRTQIDLDDISHALQ